ncbi:MAG: NAD(P)-binding protein, partial [Desulfobacterales bacterium]|nr:NAD(P)-binding protein [Desulfobacterales bacterium]
MKKEYDAVIIGGGSMGLTLGAYLQKAGLETAIFERRWEEGSAIYTSECTATGFLHNLHANFMEFMRWHPVYHDFNLEALGARMIYPHAQAAIGFSDGRPPIVLYSVENPENFNKTHKSIAQYSKHDADTYVDLRQKVHNLQDMIAMAYYSPPPQDAEAALAQGSMIFDMLGIPGYLSNASCKAVIDYLYESPEMKTMMYRILQEFGPELEMEGLGGMAIG